jgi:hypothetical protein
MQELKKSRVFWTRIAVNSGGTTNTLQSVNLYQITWYLRDVHRCKNLNVAVTK